MECWWNVCCEMLGSLYGSTQFTVHSSLSCMCMMRKRRLHCTALPFFFFYIFFFSCFVAQAVLCVL